MACVVHLCTGISDIQARVEAVQDRIVTAFEAQDGGESAHANAADNGTGLHGGTRVCGELTAAVLLTAV